jgi:hypothetical protein
MMPGPFELIIILVIVLLLFGGKREFPKTNIKHSSVLFGFFFFNNFSVNDSVFIVDFVTFTLFH